MLPSKVVVPPSAAAAPRTVPMCIVPMERQKAERRAHDARKVRIMEQGKRKEIQLTQEATKEVHSSVREP